MWFLILLAVVVGAFVWKPSRTLLINTFKIPVPSDPLDPDKKA